jgi:hypothetical protein
MTTLAEVVLGLTKYHTSKPPLPPHPPDVNLVSATPPKVTPEITGDTPEIHESAETTKRRFVPVGDTPAIVMLEYGLVPPLVLP